MIIRLMDCTSIATGLPGRRGDELKIEIPQEADALLIPL
jgi:hypothetical protein